MQVNLSIDFEGRTFPERIWASSRVYDDADYRGAYERILFAESCVTYHGDEPCFERTQVGCYALLAVGFRVGLLSWHERTRDNATRSVLWDPNATNILYKAIVRAFFETPSTRLEEGIKVLCNAANRAMLDSVRAVDDGRLNGDSFHASFGPIATIVDRFVEKWLEEVVIPRCRDSGEEFADKENEDVLSS